MSIEAVEAPEDRNLAWIGDAALGLAAREWILETYGTLQGEIYRVVTSNKFLRVFGHPTRVEAGIGILLQEQGMDAVRSDFRARILPEFKGRYGDLIAANTVP